MGGGGLILKMVIGFDQLFPEKTGLMRIFRLPTHLFFTGY
jgi:hypothetical protein